MTVMLPQFHHCDCEMCEWPNFGTLFKFPCIVRIYAWFFMHCRNHHSDSHANHVIITPWYLHHIEVQLYIEAGLWTANFVLRYSIFLINFPSISFSIFGEHECYTGKLQFSHWMSHFQVNSNFPSCPQWCMHTRDLRTISISQNISYW